MTPLKVRQQAYHFAETNPECSIQSAFVQGFLYAQQYYDIADDEIIDTPSCHCASPVPNVVEPSFDIAWQLYQRKDNEQSARKAWKRLSLKERQQALSHIPLFVKARPNKKYRPMLSTYLNQKRFNDEEIITDEQPTEQQQRFAAYADAIQGLNSRS